MKSQSVFVTLIWLIILTLTLQGAGFADNIPDELGQVEAELDVNTPMFWIWNEDLELLQAPRTLTQK